MKQDRHEWEFIKDDKMKVVKHFKRETVDPESLDYFYVYLGVATHSETHEKLVIYQSLIGNNLWARPFDMWMSEVDHQKYPDIKQQYRFEIISNEERLALRQLTQKKLKETQSDVNTYINALNLL